VAKWEQEAEVKMEKIESFICSTLDQLRKREYAHIARVPKDKCMNTNHVKAKEETETKLNAMEITYTRFKIVDDEKNSRLRIRWREDKKEEEKRFSYKLKPKADQMKAAEEFRAELVKRMFL
jgi:hypothetical protein